MNDKEKLLDSICPGMDLRKSFFKAVYCYELSSPGFADGAIERLENAGCSKARQYYETWVDAYEADREAMLKRVAEWYSRWNHHRTRKKEGTTWQERMKNLSRPQLKRLLTRLLEEGILDDPEQLVQIMEEEETYL